MARELLPHLQDENIPPEQQIQEVATQLSRDLTVNSILQQQLCLAPQQERPVHEMRNRHLPSAYGGARRLPAIYLTHGETLKDLQHQQ